MNGKIIYSVCTTICLLNCIKCLVVFFFMYKESLVNKLNKRAALKNKIKTMSRKIIFQ